MIIPPSVLAVVLGSLAEVSIGKILIAGILPGFLIAGMNIACIVLQGIAGSLAAVDPKIPRHISRFQPDYRFDNPTGNIGAAEAPGHLSWR